MHVRSLSVGIKGFHFEALFEPVNAFTVRNIMSENCGCRLNNHIWAVLCPTLRNFKSWCRGMCRNQVHLLFLLSLLLFCSYQTKPCTEALFPWSSLLFSFQDDLLSSTIYAWLPLILNLFQIYEGFVKFRARTL